MSRPGESSAQGAAGGRGGVAAAGYEHLSAAERALVALLAYRPALDVGVRFDPAPALAELEALALPPRPERQRAAEGRGWASLALRNRGGRSMASIEDDDALQDQPLAWTAEAARCPRLQALVAGLIDVERCGTIFAMTLGPHGEIAAHSDSPEVEVESSLNLALRHPEGCEMRLGLQPGGGQAPDTLVAPFAAGRGLLLNVASWHHIANPSAEPRVHVVVRAPWQQGALRRVADGWLRALLDGGDALGTP